MTQCGKEEARSCEWCSDNIWWTEAQGEIEEAYRLLAEGPLTTVGAVLAELGERERGGV